MVSSIRGRTTTTSSHSKCLFLWLCCAALCQATTGASAVGVAGYKSRSTHSDCGGYTNRRHHGGHGGPFARQISRRHPTRLRKRTVSAFRTTPVGCTGSSTCTTSRRTAAWCLPSSLLLSSSAALLDSSFTSGGPPTPLLLTESTLWLLRIGSAVTTYVGAVTLLDRPRGKLMVDLATDVEIQPSTVPGAGLGLFCKTAMPRGTVLGTYPGAVLPLQQNLSKLANFPPCEGYIWRFSDNRSVIDPTSRTGELELACRGGNPSMPGSLWWFQTVLPFLQVSTALCRINEPPIGRDVNVVTNEDLKARTVTFELERNVYAGEELFIDYGLSYDRSMYK